MRLDSLRSDAQDLEYAFHKVDEQAALQEILSVLRNHASELSNRNVVSLLENYFTEMAVIVQELGRVVRPGGNVFMVNDNFILSRGNIALTYPMFNTLQKDETTLDG